MTDMARERLLEYLCTIRTVHTDPDFDLESCDAYLARFFEFDMAHYSLLHRATFE
jgi:hypothetical protein